MLNRPLFIKKQMGMIIEDRIDAEIKPRQNKWHFICFFKIFEDVFIVASFDNKRFYSLHDQEEDYAKG